MLTGEVDRLTSALEQAQRGADTATQAQSERDELALQASPCLLFIVFLQKLGDFVFVFMLLGVTFYTNTYEYIQ